MIELNFSKKKNPQQYVSTIFSDTQNTANQTGNSYDVHGFFMPRTLRFVWSSLHIKPYKRHHIGNGMYECFFKIKPEEQ